MLRKIRHVKSSNISFYISRFETNRGILFIMYPQSFFLVIFSHIDNDVEMKVFYSSKLAKILTCVTKTNTIMFLGAIFTEKEKLTDWTITHEGVHAIQWIIIASLTAVILSVVSICMALSGNADLWMLWFIPIPLSAWYLIYVLEWFVRVLIYLDKQEAYEKISWEKQASRIEDEFIYELSFTGSKPSVWKLFKKDIRSVLSGS